MKIVEHTLITVISVLLTLAPADAKIITPQERLSRCSELLETIERYPIFRRNSRANWPEALKNFDTFVILEATIQAENTQIMLRAIARNKLTDQVPIR